MGQEIIVPDSFKKMGRPAAAFAGLNPSDDNLSEGIGQSYGIIGYKGKVWSLRLRGERHNIVRPDDGTPSSYIDVIILGQAKQKSKSFYGVFDPNAAGERPICSSIDGVTPDPDVQDQQNTNCATCKRNEWKVGQNGKKQRECTDYKRLAVLILPTQTKPLLGAPLMEAVFLRVPPASLNSLAILGDTMSAQGFHYATYITRISFDPNEAHPKMVFQPLQGLTDQEAPIVLGLLKDPTVGRIVTGDVVSKPALGTNSATSTSQASSITAGPVVLTPSASPVAASVPPATNSGLGGSNDSGLGEPPPTNYGTLTKQVPVLQPSGLKDTLFGGVLAADQTMASPPQTESDTGPAEETDAALDDQIAALIAKQ
jgi:hypothetical protein